MKKSLLALAAMSAFAGVAHAQSSVTLYGIIDQGINYTNNAKGASLINMTSGVLQGSRWGLRGAEDLGGGLKAIFVLENGFDLSSGKLGQGGLMFGRQAYVGLSSTRYGSVLLGRQYDSVVDYVGPLEVGDQWGGYIAAHPGDLDNFNNAYRTNNTVKFASVNYAGLTFGGTYSFGGVSGNFSQNQIWSLGAGYSNGPLTLGAAYLNARTPSNAGGLFGNNTSTSTASAVTSPVYSGFANANTYQVIGAGGAYTFGAATIGATYSNVSFRNLGANLGAATPVFQSGQNATFNNAEINFKYQFTPALLAGVAFDYTDGNSVAKIGGGDASAKYYQYSAGVDYFLSKRTDVYVTGVYQHASGTDSTGGPAVAAINNLSPSTTPNQVTVRVGIRHKF
ncbi:porin [Paraburkholderia caballeronis]|uniref:Outer membrane protein (Porin) n=1 Tax=Paraburkholderia caballeronis TaxID=416943 RepID=A0A1H7Q304_9BURK|nr:porin [Paraburkholderia caballeronis]PXW24469.1 putative porin [Paraburkholderia caballeronis]PXX00251.1 putative porin [Paraburkholderia caballeronis]RAJ97380.1 putative porin [Paraburkholderia caballeronis]SEB61258.1 Outer membrane protein (porin) [Paraburkholderia caballeronis]SEL42226.1 Outer membrane protein (porin) [Paraburkholderia caballeronis]